MKKPIFDFIDRQIIIDFYRNPPKDKFWSTPLVVSQYEITKSKKELHKQFEKPFLKIDDFIASIFTALKR